MKLMEIVKIGGFFVSLGTAILLSLGMYNGFKDAQAAILIELKGIHTSLDGISHRVDRLDDAIFPIPHRGQ